MKYFYEDEAVKIIHGDCREIVPQLGKFDLLLTDPPYEIVASGGGIGAKRKYLSDINGFTDGGFDMSILDFCANWFCFCAKAQLIALLQKASVRRWQLITWNKPNPTPLCNGNYLPDTEYIVHSFEPKRLFGEFRDKSRFIEFPSQQNNLHPNEKPLTVIQKLVKLGTIEGETILEPFAGSGTTGRAAKDLGRKCVMIEKEERYCAIAAKRMEQEVFAL